MDGRWNSERTALRKMAFSTLDSKEKPTVTARKECLIFPNPQVDFPLSCASWTCNSLFVCHFCFLTLNFLHYMHFPMLFRCQYQHYTSIYMILNMVISLDKSRDWSPEEKRQIFLQTWKNVPGFPKDLRFFFINLKGSHTHIHPIIASAPVTLRDKCPL